MSLELERRIAWQRLIQAAQAHAAYTALPWDEDAVQEWESSVQHEKDLWIRVKEAVHVASRFGDIQIPKEGERFLGMQRGAGCVVLKVLQDSYQNFGKRTYTFLGVSLKGALWAPTYSSSAVISYPPRVGEIWRRDGNCNVRDKACQEGRVWFPGPQNRWESVPLLPLGNYP